MDQVGKKFDILCCYSVSVNTGHKTLTSTKLKKVVVVKKILDGCLTKGEEATAIGLTTRPERIIFNRKRTTLQSFWKEHEAVELNSPSIYQEQTNILQKNRSKISISDRLSICRCGQLRPIYIVMLLYK